jgi:hypothetical protein
VNWGRGQLPGHFSIRLVEGTSLASLHQKEGQATVYLLTGASTMKTPSNYGSENEETSFIRRVAAPDRPNSKRRQKKRLALAGAAMVLIGASAGVGYATFKSAQSEAVAKQQMAASLEVPDFVDSLGDPYFPTFEELDQDGDGIVGYDEYMRDLNLVWAKNREDIANSDLPEVVKEDLNNQLNAKIESDTACVKKAMISVSTGSC